MEAQKSTAGRFYRPELDVVRFLAFLLVFLYHLLPNLLYDILPGGNGPHDHKSLGGLMPFYYAAQSCIFGMSLFFTLSAFLICELLLREREAVGQVSVKQFYIRRILRIWPVYYLALALGVVVALLPGGHRSDVIEIGWFAVFLGAWRVAVHGSLFNPVDPLWSISVEEQFYLFAPWAVKFLNRKYLYGFCAFLILFSNGWLAYLCSTAATDHRIWFDAFVHFECFAGGILLCLVLQGRAPSFPLRDRFILLACAWCFWLAATYLLNSRLGGAVVNPGIGPSIGAYALAATGAVLILVAFLGVTPRLLPRWAIYLGRISYGLYVYHFFAERILMYLPFTRTTAFQISFYPMRVCAMAGVDLVLPLGLTVLLAALSHRYFEAPFLKMKKRHALIQSQPIGGKI